MQKLLHAVPLITGLLLSGISTGILVYLYIGKNGRHAGTAAGPAIPARYNAFYWASAGFALGAITSGKIAFSCLAAFLFRFIPYFLKKYDEKIFMEKFNGQLVSAMGMVSSSLKAGQSLVQAIGGSAGRLPLPIRREFEIIANENKMGVPLTESLKAMAGRIRSEDVGLMVNATAVCLETGGNITEMYDKIASTIRARIRLKAKVSALTSQGKLQGLIVGLLPVIMLFVLGWLAPEMTSPLFTTFEGILMLVAAFAMELLGAYFIIRITSID